MFFFSPWRSWHWCSDLVRPRPPGSSGSLGSLGLNGKHWWDVAIEKKKKKTSSEILQWGYWLGRMVLYLSLIICPGTSSSAALTKFGGIFCGGEGDMLSNQTWRRHKNQLDQRASHSYSDEEAAEFTNVVLWLFVTWYSVLSVLVSLEASCSIAWVRGREEVWSNWSHTSLGVVTEHMVSTPKVLTSNSSDRLEPLLQNKTTQVMLSLEQTFI